MSESQKSKRVALSWNPEFKDRVPDLEAKLKLINGGLAPTNLDTFMFCLGYGFANNVKSKIPPKASDAVRIEYLKDEMAFLRLVAMYSTKREDVLLDVELVYDEAEMFAGGGLALLVHEMDTNHDFEGYVNSLLFNNIKIMSPVNQDNIIARSHKFPDGTVSPVL